MKNGGTVRFAGNEKIVSNYNTLPLGPRSSGYMLEEINAKGITLTDNGFEHLGIRLKIIQFLEILCFRLGD